ncbi:hypothetical protein TNCV_3115421 [Trichonephila clavipes]|nr:hypothetical protein TNCV_3115421 [Trichonephila clavipes]
MSFWTSPCLVNGSRRECCLIGGCSPVSIRCFVSLVLPKSSDVLENRPWNSLINPPAAHLCFSSKSVFCSKFLTRFSEERSWVYTSDRSTSCYYLSFLDSPRPITDVSNSHWDDRIREVYYRRGYQYSCF